MNKSLIFCISVLSSVTMTVTYADVSCSSYPSTTAQTVCSQINTLVQQANQAFKSMFPSAPPGLNGNPVKSPQSAPKQSQVYSSPNPNNSSSSNSNVHINYD